MSRRLLALQALTLVLAASMVLTQQIWASPLIARLNTPDIGSSRTTINYQGFLTDSANVPVNDTLTMAFRLYTMPEGGTSLWSETQDAVVVSNGLFSVLLGSVSPISLNIIANNSDLWLGIAIGGDTEMIPRDRIASAPYAMIADVADGSITRSKLADNAVDSSKIQDGQVGTVDLANGAVTSAKIQDGQVTTADLAGGAVTSEKLASSAVATANIANSAVVVSKMNINADLNVRGYKLLDVKSITIGSQGTISDKVGLDGTGPNMVFETDDRFTFQQSDGYFSISPSLPGTTIFSSGWLYSAATIVPTQDSLFNLGGANTRRWNSIYVRNVYSGDISEDIDLDYTPETGDVVVWQNGQLLKSSAANDPRVFGVAKVTSDRPSGAPVTLGIFEIKVAGSVSEGDFLVTSDMPGHAMASHSPMIGTVIATALESFDGDSGLIRAMIRKF